MTDAFKTLTGAPIPAHHHTPTPDDTLHQLRSNDRIVPRYPAEGGQVPEDAFDLPPAEQRPAGRDDAYIATSLRHAAEMLADWVITAREAGLTVDITWDRENDRPFITIVREF